MFSPEEYELALKDVVNAKRLSASKMASLTDMTMKNVEHDTQIVSILYRTHKSLSSSNAKISSLYVFDALSRAAKTHSYKHGLSGDAFTQPGNSASFLYKVGGVVEGLFQDMLSIGSPEAKDLIKGGTKIGYFVLPYEFEEKTKKILDIWDRGSTFPADVISHLKLVVGDVEKVPSTKIEPTTDPRVVNVPPPPHSPPIPAHSPTIPTFGGANPQAALLALLTQAAAAIPTIPTVPPPPILNSAGSPPPQLDAAQLAVIQQLAQTAASVPPVSQSLPFAESVNVQKFPSSSGFNNSSQTIPSFRNEPRTMVQNEQKYNGYRSPESESRHESHFDNRDNMRGRYRGGFRHSDRVERFQGRNWDDRDRDYYHRDTERDRSPLHRGRNGRSRSRSPPSRYGGRKDSRYFSPPRRNVSAPTTQFGQRKVSQEPEPGKDEFGRDIRPESPTESTDTIRTNTKSPSRPSIPPSSPTRSNVVPAAPIPNTEISDSSVDTVITPGLTTNNPSVSAEASSAQPSAPTAGLGMENFNPSTFDYTSPTSWEALGKMWQVTNGYLPSTEELMQFVVSGFSMQPTPSAEATTHALEPNHMFHNGGRGGGRGGFSFAGPGRGGSARGNVRTNMPEGNDWARNNQATDAVVLGGGNDEVDQYAVKSTVFATGQDAHNPTSSNATAGGRMQRVGDKWVFVREERAPVHVS
ncbi:hypothetical protein D9613_006997 [Agrocybe pediades]|uniref:CID domain-containing protein n=1 Tax=Agrocybe pediades TaxID=84607 RepID=A0A8H4QGV8_9AGAR|nr:hypothetical protein D9613_006997 [Agrocybe pediades]